MAALRAIHGCYFQQAAIPGSCRQSSQRPAKYGWPVAWQFPGGRRLAFPGPCGQLTRTSGVLQAQEKGLTRLAFLIGARWQIPATGNA